MSFSEYTFFSRISTIHRTRNEIVYFMKNWSFNHCSEYSFRHLFSEMYSSLSQSLSVSEFFGCCSESERRFVFKYTSYFWNFCCVVLYSFEAFQVLRTFIQPACCFESSSKWDEHSSNLYHHIKCCFSRRVAEAYHIVQRSFFFSESCYFSVQSNITFICFSTVA